MFAEKNPERHLNRPHESHRVLITVPRQYRHFSRKVNPAPVEIFTRT
jgi:hypothetical protein